MPTSSPTPYVWDWSEEDPGDPEDEDDSTAGLDKLGNWNYWQYGVVGSLTTDDRGHNDVNEVTSRTCTNRQAPSWNDNGNLTCDGITNHQPFGSNTKLNYTYDYRNRLRGVYDDSGTPKTIAEYTYDALNRRVRKQTYDSEGADDADTWFLWSGWQCIEERDDPTDEDTVLRRYVYGATYVDDHVAMLVPSGASWTIYYTLQDRMQHVVALADSSGVVQERYDYDPYGKVHIYAEDGTTPRTASSYGNPYTYTGRYWDADAGLYYYRNRWYSADLGRGLQCDPRSPTGYGGYGGHGDGALRAYPNNL